MDQPNSNLSGNSGPNGHGGDDFPVIEGYDVIDLIGRGGMGAVYEALQQSTGRRVAVKLMLERAGATEAARRRFEREVELIARLTHPGIVSVLDSGLHKSRYFYVMEHVDGKSLDEAMPPGNCSVRDALRAIAKVARAVEYAHQRGVMHRDLKPSNVLVDERGEPRLLDFGLAKAFDPNSLINVRDSLSEPGQVIGTLGYMSPEQARGAVAEVSVRADVYALGAIAYELITGRLPCAIDGPMAIVFHRIESRDPERPSSIRKEIDADVDAVLLKALEKSPSKRYATVAEFADDLEHWLDGRSVKARRISALHRGARWCRRNPAVAGVVVAVILLVGVVGFAGWRESVGREKARIAETERQREIQKAEEFDDFMLQSVERLDPDKGTGLAEDARKDLAKLEQSLRSTPRPPEREALRRLKIGVLYKKWGDLDKSLSNLNRALALQRTLHAEPHEEIARCLYEIGGTNFFYWRLDDAERSCQAALDMRRRAHAAPDSMEVADSLNYLAQTLGRKRRFDRAKALQQEAIEMAVRISGEGSEKAVAFRNNYGTILKDQGDFAEAERIYQTALDALRASRKGQSHRFIATSLRNIATCRMEQGVHDGIEPLLIEAQSIASAYYVGVPHPDLALINRELACFYLEQGRHKEAEATGREALLVLETSRGPTHRESASTRVLLGRILTAAGKPDEGESEIQRAIEHLRHAAPINEIDVAEAQAVLGECFLAQARVGEALAMLREAWPVLDRELGLKQRRTVACAQFLAQALEASGDSASATALRDRVGRN